MLELRGDPKSKEPVDLPNLEARESVTSREAWIQVENEYNSPTTTYFETTNSEAIQAGE